MRKESGTTIIVDNKTDRISKNGKARKTGKSSTTHRTGRGGQTRRSGHLSKAGNADRVVVVDAVRRLSPPAIASIADVVRETTPPAQPTSPSSTVTSRGNDVGQEAAGIAGVAGADQGNEGLERLERLLGPRLSEEDRVANEVIATMRGFERRRQLLQDSLTATQVATALGVSRETVYGRAERGQLLGASDAGQLRFPRWQFDPASDTGLLAGLPDVVKALGDRPQLAKIVWLMSPRSSLGDTPLHLIMEGSAATVMGAAERFALGE